MESLWFGIIIIALYIWGETVSTVKANRQAQMKRRETIRYPLYGRDGKYVRGGR